MMLSACSPLSEPKSRVYMYNVYTMHVDKFSQRKTRGLCLRTNLAICQSSRSCTHTPFLPQGSKLTLFSLYEEQFSRYGPIFKIAIFGHETWSLAKVPEVTHILSFHPRGSKLSLFSLYGQWFSRYGLIFKTAIWAWNLAIGQSARCCTYTLFIPQGVEIKFIFTLRAAVSEIQADFQQLYILYLNCPWVPNFTLFCSTAGHSQDIGFFFFFCIFPLGTIKKFKFEI